MHRSRKWSLLKCASIVALSVATGTVAFAQTFKVGDLVEVDDTAMNSWERAVVMPFKPGDVQDGNTFRVKRVNVGPYSLRDPEGEISQTIHIRMATSASAVSAAPAATATSSYASAATSHAPSTSSPASARYSPAVTTTPSPKATSPSSTSTSTSGLNPKMEGAFPSLPGTGWDLMGLQKKGEAPSTPKSFAQSFSFCKTGRWSVTRYGLAAGQMGTYTVQGSRLVMINSLNNEPFGNFSMTWRGGDKSLILDDGKWIWTLKLVSLNACGEK